MILIGDFLGVENYWNLQIANDPDCQLPFVNAKEGWWEMANQGHLRSCAILDMLCRYSLLDLSSSFPSSLSSLFYVFLANSVCLEWHMMTPLLKFAL